VSKKFLFLTSFVLLISLAYNSYGDTFKPKPSTMTWRIVPATLGPTSITMTATTALDANDMPVEYLFECTNISAASSTWQSEATYTATGLTPSTVYTFRIRARDSVGNMNNWTTYSRPATTDAVTTPPALRLDLNNSANNDDDNTQTGFLPFTIGDSGSEVNGIAIDLGGDITSNRRGDPGGAWTKYDIGGSIPGDPCYYSPRAGERIYRDFVYGISPSGVTITLWGLGTNRDCNITIWAYDACSVGDANKIANWYSNDTHIFDTIFKSNGSTGWPRYDNQQAGSYLDLYKYAFKGRATSDDLGRIILTSSRDPESPDGQPFAYVNAIKVEPNSLQTFTPTNYAYHPLPVDGADGVPVDATLVWKQGGYAEKHDVYFSTDFNDVNGANRSNPLGVLVSQDHLTTTYTPPKFLHLDTTYYWRIDEVSAAPDYTIFNGGVWSFKTLPYFVVENFNSYEDNNALWNVWKNGSTSAEVSVEAAIVRNGKSMKYWYKNNLWPYYSEAYADIADLGIDDPNWLGIGAKTLSLRFYGQAGNDVNQPMYVKLTDGDVSPHTAQVNYDGDVNNIRGGVYSTEWHEWNINLQDFVDNNNVNLSNVKTITIGFGDGTQAAGDGTVYFEDIRLYEYNRICPTVAVTGDLNGDCAVNYRDLKILTDNWLADCTAPDNCRGADFEPTDGIVNLFDFGDLAMQWLWQENPCGEDIPPMPSFSALPSNPYYPDPFRFMSGSRVTTKAEWTCRRAEIAVMIQEYELGYMQYTPYSATTGSFNGTNSITVTVNDNEHQASFNCSITYPSTGSPPYPAMIGYGGISLNGTALSNMGVARINLSTSATPFNTLYGSGNSVSSMMKAAWNLSRLIDAIEKTPAANIDPTRLGITGCSASGKGALVCGAFNERIKLTIPQESGAGGCASWRGIQSEGGCETMAGVVSLGAFSDNFTQFVNHADKLPFDHHMLAGMCAPNALLFVENTTHGWLCGQSCWTNGNVTHMIYEALGIPDKMGFSGVGGHEHCAFPSSQQPDVTAYVQKFLVGGGTADTNIMYTDGGFPFDEAHWVDWTVPNLE
jgi:hypothetical protein